MIYTAENRMYRGFMATLGEIVKERRTLLKMTQRQLGTATGVSHAYINQIEAGEVNLPSPAVLAPLARARGTLRIECYRRRRFGNDMRTTW